MDNQLLELENKFDNWLSTIKGVLSTPITSLEKSLDTEAIGGKSLSEIESIVDGLLLDHTSKTNPHEMTLKQLNLLSEEDILNMTVLYQRKKNIPLSFVDDLNGKVTVDWSSSKITVESFDFTFMGNQLTTDEVTLNLLGTNTGYLMLNVSYNNGLNSPVFSMSSNPTVSFRSFPLIKIVKDVNTVKTRRIVRIGANELSLTPRGTTIPVSGGASQASIGSLDSGWFI